MRWLSFLSRLSFICGFCFLIAMSLLIKDWLHDEAFTSTILIIGFVIGVIVVPITLICYLVVILARKKLNIPVWLVVSNILFLFILLIYIIFINVDKPNPPA
jgi:hypothetical protein